MNITLSGKVAVITGGTRGIGFSIAKVFGMEGAKVAICGRSEDRLKDALDELKELGIEAFGMAIDVSDEMQFSEFADSVESKFGGIDIWINNAGIYPNSKITDMTTSEWTESFAVNVNSVFIGSRLAKEKLIKRNGGVLINAASFAALMPSVNRGAYAATKAAIYSMTKTLAAELAPNNIRVLGYIPGVIETDLTMPVIVSGGDSVLSQLALNRIGKPDEVAYPLLFLASEYASYITGTFIEISGGKFCVQNPRQAWV